MSKSATSTGPDWRTARRRSAREALLTSAWELVREDGLAALSLRGLADRAGTTTTTVYAYFDSKNAIFDAMFAQAADAFADRMAEPYDEDDPRRVLVAGAHRFVDFCVSDLPRYQLLFQRGVPGFAPSDDAYSGAVRALEGATAQLRAVGVTEPRHVDLWTALITGLVDQQVANQPGGDRWTRLVDESVEMFLTHCTNGEPSWPTAKKPPRTS